MGAKKVKKPSVEDSAKKRIVELYMHKNKELLLFSRATVKSNSGNLFVAIDKTGITLYEFKDTNESKIMLLETHQWKEWDQVLIDHYFSKSTFQFTRDNISWSVSIDLKGKEVQQIITSFSNINIRVASRPWYKKILGFRSWKTWKMIIATVVYSILLLSVINSFTAQKTDHMLGTIGLTFSILTFFVLLIGLCKPKYVLPFSTIKNRKKVGSIYGTVCILTLIMFFIFTPANQPNQAQVRDKVNSAEIAQNKLPEPEIVESSEEQKVPSEVTKITAVVTRVVDGDTIEVEVNGKEETVRMILVHTPETKHPRLGVQPFGPEASYFTQNTLTGKKVELEKDISERDRYGRLLRYVWIDGKLFNQILIEKGFARVAVFQPDVKYVDQFRKTQKKSQNQGIGIWSIENYAQEDGYNPPQKKQTTAKAPQPTSKPKQETKPASGSCNVKGNISSRGEKIYHVPGGQFYEVTDPERIFCSAAEARGAGYRASKR